MPTGRSDEARLLSIKGLHVEYRTLEGVVRAVNGLDLEVREGMALGLVGETGAGKTTTALSVMRLLPSPPAVVTGGEIIFENRHLLGLSEEAMQKLRGNKVSMIFQNPMASLNPVLTVGFQISEVIQVHRKTGAREAARQARELLRAVGIPESRAGDFPHEFSGGMRQRVMIAMALACRPRLLIADEPTTALDVTIQAQVLALMKELKREFGGAQILITHDLGVVADFCDEVAVMYAGRIVEAGLLEQVFANPGHPYTAGLFACVPRLERAVKRLVPIKGCSPDPRVLPVGCAFAPRCPEAVDICTESVPEPVVLEDGHLVACWERGDGRGINR